MEREHTHTHITEIQIESERRTRSSKEVFNSIKQNYRAGWRGVTFNGPMFYYKNFFKLKHGLHINVIIHFSVKYIGFIRRKTGTQFFQLQ